MFGFFENSLQTKNSVVANRDSCSYTVLAGTFHNTFEDFPSLKFRQPTHLQSNVVYKIPCKDCSWNYIGETGRCFQTRKKEHQRHLKNYAKGSNVANHAWKNNHSIDFDNTCVIDKGKTLESWHTAKTFDANNNSKPLPRQYSILL